jgi:hypothetical protein
MVTELNNERLSQEKFDKQAQAFYDTSPLKNIPHWYIDLRPDTFDENYIRKDFPKYLGKIKSCSYNSEGWYRPYVDLTPGSYSHDEGTDGKGTNWIDSRDNNDYSKIIAYWRFHSNGQFVHFLSLEAEKQTKSIGNKQETPYQVGINSIKYTTREIFNFAGRLAQYLEATAFIKIRIVNIKGFVLYHDGELPLIINSYPAFENPCLDPIKLDKTALTSEDMDKLAQKAEDSIFKYFSYQHRRQQRPDVL